MKKNEEVEAEYYRIREEGNKQELIDFIRRVPVVPDEIKKGE